MSAGRVGPQQPRPAQSRSGSPLTVRSCVGAWWRRLSRAPSSAERRAPLQPRLTARSGCPA